MKVKFNIIHIHFPPGIMDLKNPWTSFSTFFPKFPILLRSFSTSLKILFLIFLKVWSISFLIESTILLPISLIFSLLISLAWITPFLKSSLTYFRSFSSFSSISTYFAILLSLLGFSIHLVCTSISLFKYSSLVSPFFWGIGP